MKYVKAHYGQKVKFSNVKPGGTQEGWNFNSGNYLFTTDTK